jgi:hypothetical protein
MDAKLTLQYLTTALERVEAHLKDMPYRSQRSWERPACLTIDPLLLPSQESPSSCNEVAFSLYARAMVIRANEQDVISSPQNLILAQAVILFNMALTPAFYRLVISQVRGVLSSSTSSLSASFDSFRKTLLWKHLRAQRPSTSTCVCE